MALSNWDTLAINNDGKTCPGQYTFKNGTTVQVYKNWCYVSNPDLWKDGFGFTNDVIVQFNEGDASFAGINITAKRGPQSSIFLCATSGYGKEKEVFAGIGCYGYGDRCAEYLKSKNIEYKEILGTGSRSTPGSEEWTEIIDYSTEKKNLIELIVDKDFGELNYWAGVEKETLEEFKNWLNEETLEKEWFQKIDWESLLRFNQGDNYIMEKLGVPGAVPASRPGESDNTLMSQILQQ